MTWKSTADILESIHDAHELLLGGELTAAQAKAAAALMGNAVKVLQVQLAHSKATEQLKGKGERLPAVQLDAPTPSDDGDGEATR